jgi:hypothetical protein
MAVSFSTVLDLGAAADPAGRPCKKRLYLKQGEQKRNPESLKLTPAIPEIAVH